MGREAKSKVNPARFFFNNINYPARPNPGLTMHDMLRILVYGPQKSCRLGCLIFKAFYDVGLLLNTEIVHFVKGKLHFSKVPNTHAYAKRDAGLAAGLAGFMVFLHTSGVS